MPTFHWIEIENDILSFETHRFECDRPKVVGRVSATQEAKKAEWGSF